MPIYEMPILIRVMSKPNTVAALKRAAQIIFNEGGFIRKIDNLGRKQTPFKMSNHGQKFREAQYFIYYLEVPPSSLDNIRNEYSLDVDIIKQFIFSKNEPERYDCTLHEETLPPPYRSNVKKMVELAHIKATRKNFREKYFKDLKDFPFQT